MSQRENQTIESVFWKMLKQKRKMMNNKIYENFLAENLEKKKATKFELIENGMGDDAEGDLSFGCGSACRLLCCLKPSSLETSPQIWKINEGLKEISRKLENLERKANGQNPISCRSTGMPSGGSDKWNDLEEDEQAELDDDREMRQQSLDAMKHRKGKRVSSETWLLDPSLRRAERDHLEIEEEQFWNDMIEKYLQPIPVDPKEQERIKKGLTDLRNKVCSAFFMLNVVFIIIVLVLQMQKDCLHIEWPLGPKFNHTIIPCNSDNRQEIWVMTRLQLEPIGLVFLVFFMSILIIQVSKKKQFPCETKNFVFHSRPLNPGFFHVGPRQYFFRKFPCETTGVFILKKENKLFYANFVFGYKILAS